MFEMVHIGMPNNQKREGEKYMEGAKVYITPPELSPFSIEYLRFMPESNFPEEVKSNPHIAANVDSIEEYLKYADSIIIPKMDNGDFYLCFIKKDGVIIELMEKK